MENRGLPIGEEFFKSQEWIRKESKSNDPGTANLHLKLPDFEASITIDFFPKSIKKKSKQI
jgi:hypothetical protein